MSEGPTCELDYDEILQALVERTTMHITELRYGNALENGLSIKSPRIYLRMFVIYQAYV